MRKGFTLIELLLVVVVIGILAGFVLPKFGDIKSKARNAALQNDLRNLVNAQEFYFDANGQYAVGTVSAADPANPETIAGLNYSVSDHVTVEITQQGDGYTAVATHGVTGASCTIEMGSGADQKIRCD